jgi:hypothetical protein
VASGQCSREGNVRVVGERRAISSHICRGRGGSDIVAIDVNVNVKCKFFFQGLGPLACSGFRIYFLKL